MTTLIVTDRRPDETRREAIARRLRGELAQLNLSHSEVRHRAATRGYAATGNLRAVQEFLGHASVATTERYTAVSSREIRAMVEAAGGWRCLT